MSFETQLRELLKTIKDASFNKVTLEQFKKIPETLRPAFLSHDDNSVKLAAEVYAEMLKKSLSFFSEVKEEKIKPNDEGWRLCEELIDAVYEENTYLIQTFPQIATEGKLGDVQQLLPSLKTAIQKKRTENPSPNNPSQPKDNTYLGVIAFVVIIGVIALGIFWIFKKRKSAS